MLKIKRYGWKRGLPVFGHPKFEKACMAATPARADLTADMPVVVNQGNLGSCTACAGAGLFQFLNKKMGWVDYMPSRLAIYYWTRMLMGTVSEDSGASLTDTMKILSRKGAPNEKLWGYNIEKFTHTPPTSVAVNGKMHLVKDPLQVSQTMDDIRACISFGYPVIFGFTVYESFESDVVTRTGVMSMPNYWEQILGGHAVVAVGYDDYTKLVKCRNSWGSAWGDKGYFYMPYDYIANPWLCDDFWTAQVVSGWKPGK